MRPADDVNWLSARRIARELDKVLDATGPRRGAAARAAGELRLSTRRIYTLLARYRRERTVSSLLSRKGAPRRKRLDDDAEAIIAATLREQWLILEAPPRRRRDAIFSTGVAPRQRHDLPATSTRSARPLSRLPPGLSRCT